MIELECFICVMIYLSFDLIAYTDTTNIANAGFYTISIILSLQILLNLDHNNIETYE